MATGYVFEEIFTRHDFPGHPENANRLQAIMDYLNKQDLLARLTHIPARPATRTELLRCHHPRHVEAVEEISRRGGGMLDADTYTTPYSYEGAVQAAGGLVGLMAEVLAGRLDNGFALVRPPGHHATPIRAMGFCLFSTIAIAARAARFDYGLERVAVIDFDVHHGNGTQDVLIEDPTVLFVSSHQYPFYPGTGAVDEIGEGPARGTTLNIPLAMGTGDNGYKQLYSQVVFPVLRRFQPQLILISAGFDAHWNDPLANMGLTLSGYHWLSQQLIELAAELCQGKIVFVLEGGYNLEVLALGAGNVFRSLLGQNEPRDPLGPSPWPEPDIATLLAKLKKVHDVA